MLRSQHKYNTRSFEMCVCIIVWRGTLAWCNGEVFLVEKHFRRDIGQAWYLSWFLYPRMLFVPVLEQWQHWTMYARALTIATACDPNSIRYHTKPRYHTWNIGYWKIFLWSKSVLQHCFLQTLPQRTVFWVLSIPWGVLRALACFLGALFVLLSDDCRFRLDLAPCCGVACTVPISLSDSSPDPKNSSSDTDSLGSFIPWGVLRAFACFFGAFWGYPGSSGLSLPFQLLSFYCA